MSFEDDELRAEANERLGATIDEGFRLVSLLGGGAAASVYAAEDATGARRAIKVLHRQWAAVPEVRSRFLREGKASNLIRHRGAVKVFAEGTFSDGVPWLAMELLEGESLEDRWLRKGCKLPVKEVLWEADQILAVLAAAHAKGIVHRDVKPDNVFITTARVVKLLDFGIARVTDGAASADDRTRAGTLLGTPAFLPPEQARGDGVDVGVQTDLWAVGATMFTLLSGRHVHEARDVIGQLVAATTQPAPSLAVVAPHVPALIVDLVDFALRFDVKDRWPSANSMRQAVRVVYTEWARAPLPEELVLDADDQGARMLYAPSAPPPSVALTPEMAEALSRSVAKKNDG